MRTQLRAFVPALLLLSAAAPRPPLVLEPAGKWAIEYGETRCTLWREFGSGTTTARLSLEQTAPRRGISVLVAGTAVAKSEGRESELAFLPTTASNLRHGLGVVMSDEKTSGVYFSHALTRGKWALLSDAQSIELARSLPPNEFAYLDIPGYKNKPFKWGDFDNRREPREVIEANDRAFVQCASAIDSLMLNPGTRNQLLLHTGSMGPPLEALEKCAVDSLKDFGIDSAVEATIDTNAHPTTDPSRMITSADYPSAALSAGKESALDLWLNIDASGSISGCRVISSFSSPEINDRMCALIRKRQRFVPARRADGTPVPSYYIESFRFQLAY